MPIFFFLQNVFELDRQPTQQMVLAFQRCFVYLVLKRITLTAYSIRSVQSSAKIDNIDATPV